MGWQRNWILNLKKKKKWLKGNNIEMYSIYDDRKSVVAKEL